ncbi:2-hydroxy-6-ketonona-2,4-dienedioic acid hydrolase [Luteitalea sp. TBR-22]|uniref:alpha/beta fold hydrolase n=1 Tax=Luteitalea sp. TBR-22 TaxID=2802971 RepID=UPI001AF8F94D|nr:alpha/beta hydrolase [Luteitalea sp. TBR-22]BCS35738.1 2-hydroxy-6-ketonona-2,4-dienedioic acid hydrolase [Luteitalea sp. TBR-22]
MIVAGQGPTLLLIPGIQGRWEWARPAVQQLARHHRVVSYSLSGERDAVPPSPPRTFDDLVRQALNALNRATDGPAVVCGVSYGGLIALRLAARHPERVRALVLASPLNADFAPDARIRRWIAHPRLMAPAFIAGSPGRIVPELRAAHGAAWVPRALGLIGRVMRAPHSPDRMAQRIRLIEPEDFVSDCRSVTQPTLLVTGEPGLDRIVPAEASCRMLDWLPNARHVTLDRTGHWGIVTRREAFAREITAFVETLP